MILFYVQGGGLGHLARTDKVVRFLNLKSSDFVIITPSKFTHYFKDYQFIEISWDTSVDELHQIISEIILKHKISICYVDVFPLGIKGELEKIYKEFKNVAFNYISRILKWEKYISAHSEIDDVFFNETIVLEKLYKAHQRWIELNSEKVTQLILPYSEIEDSIKLSEKPYSIVIHSGGKEDLKTICEFANMDTNDHIFVFTQVNLEYKNGKFTFIKGEFPVSKYYKYASKIYTAAGFNSIQELKPYRLKHIAIPIERLYDDQYFRIKNNNPIFNFQENLR